MTTRERSWRTKPMREEANLRRSKRKGVMTTTPRGRAADDEVETEHEGARDHKRERGMNTTAEHEGGPRDDEGGPRMTRGRNERGDVRGAEERHR